MRTIVKVEWDAIRQRWDLRDDSGQVRQKVLGSHLPTRVREAVEVAHRAYFHAEVRGKELAFGNRVLGDPGLVGVWSQRSNR